MSQLNRDKLIDRIRSLMAKTVENGCTEAEAIAAAVKISELKNKYDIEFAEILSRENKVKTEKYDFKDEVDQFLDFVVIAIGRLTDTIATKNGKRFAASQITFIGREDDVDVALYILEIVERSIRHELNIFFKSKLSFMAVNSRRIPRRDFLLGITHRLQERILEIDWTRRKYDPDAEARSTKKMTSIANHLSENGLKLRNNREYRIYNTEAMNRGKNAANRIDLNAGIQSDERKRIL